MNLRNNLFGGTIPSSFGTVSFDVVLLGNNSLTGTVPGSLVSGLVRYCGVGSLGVASLPPSTLPQYDLPVVPRFPLPVKWTSARTC